jgi:hypothetical protein
MQMSMRKMVLKAAESTRNADCSVSTPLFWGFARLSWLLSPLSENLTLALEEANSLFCGEIERTSPHGALEVSGIFTCIPLGSQGVALQRFVSRPGLISRVAVSIFYSCRVCSAPPWRCAWTLSALLTRQRSTAHRGKRVTAVCCHVGTSVGVFSPDPLQFFFFSTLYFAQYILYIPV